MAITPGTFDVIFNSLKTTLETYNSTQDPSDQFVLYADYYRTLPSSSDIASVFLYMGSIVPTERTTEGYQQQTVTYFIDCVVQQSGTKTGAVYTRADESAGVRFRGLVQQIFEAVFQANNLNFGEEIGTIGTKELRFDPLPPDPQMAERVVLGGRFTLTLSMCWEAAELTGVDLDSILITADKWSALIEP